MHCRYMIIHGNELAEQGNTGGGTVQLDKSVNIPACPVSNT